MLAQLGDPLELVTANLTLVIQCRLHYTGGGGVVAVTIQHVTFNVLGSGKRHFAHRTLVSNAVVELHVPLQVRISVDQAAAFGALEFHLPVDIHLFDSRHAQHVQGRRCFII